ncbi:MAG: long-chain fatty acid--CoA ligase [Bacteroidetes bacterium]|nr:long-chain fatty acid--CoA ligase [Bacteroidota bacterium]
MVTRIFDLLDAYKDEFSSLANAFNYRKEGAWISFSARDYISYSNEISLGLLAMGVTPGVRVATIMLNCPEWNFFDMGLLQVGAVQIPIYPTISVENYKFILNDAGVEFLIVSNLEIYQRVATIANEVPTLKEIFTLEPVPGVKNWQEILSAGRQYPHPENLEKIKEEIFPGSLATIIYTSGTTGKPKGVMLSHNNFVTNYKALGEIPPLEMNDRIVSFLPLCHVYERTAGYTYQSFGTAIYYIQNLEEIAACIEEVKPHAFAAVPRVLEKVYNKMVMQGRSLPLPVKVLFFWALRQGHKFELNHARGWVYDVKLWIANRLVFSKWRKAMGGHVKFIVCGSASLHPRLTRIYWAARMPVLEAYGLTETSPGITCFRFNAGGIKFGTVGPLLKDVQVKIADDGEILVKSPGVMMGYYNRPERTAEVMDEEGWFHTGDIGMFEEGKYLKITDRKKEMFKTSGGKYIAPQVIEQKLKESPFIEHIMVIGENRSYPAALIIPNFEYLKGWCEVKEIHYVSREETVNHPAIINRIQREIDRYNEILDQTEKIKKFRLLHYEWNVTEGELSPTLKLRRNFIIDKYHQVIEEMYHSPEFNYKVEKKK